MAISYVGGNAGSEEHGYGDVSTTLPTVLDGDVALCFVDSSGSGAQVTGPSGWAPIGQPVLAEQTTVLAFYRVLSAGMSGETVTGNARFAGPETNKRTIAVEVYRGVDDQAPVHVSGQVTNNTHTADHVAPTVGVSAAGTWVVDHLVTRGGPPTAGYTLPAGRTQRHLVAQTTPGSLSAVTTDSAAAVTTGTVGGGTYSATDGVTSGSTAAISIGLAEDTGTAPPATETGTVVRRAEARSSAAGGTTLDLRIPGSVVPGDELYLFLDFSFAGIDVDHPAGFDLIAQATHSTTMLSRLYRRRATQSDRDRVVTVTATTSGIKRHAHLIAYSGALAGVPVYDVMVENTSRTTHTGAEIAAAAAGTVGLQHYIERGSPASTDVTQPADWVQLLEEAQAGGGALTTHTSQRTALASGPGSLIGGGVYTGASAASQVIIWTLGIAPAEVPVGDPGDWPFVPVETDGAEVPVNYYDAATDTWLPGAVAPTEPPVVATVPDPPPSVTATAGVESATLTWSAPADDGGATVTGYTVTNDLTLAEISTPNRTYVWDGLTADVAVTFTVAAVNSVGEGGGATSNAVTPAPQPGPEPPAESDYLFISSAELASLPASGPAWNALVSTASNPGTPNLQEQNSKTQSRALMAALHYKRTGGGIGRAALVNMLRAVPGTEVGPEQALNTYRQLAAWCFVADLIDFDQTTVCSNGQQWGAWVDSMFAKLLRHGTWDSVERTARISPNNWGVYARGAMIVMALHRGNTTRLEQGIAYYKRWIGHDLTIPNTFVPTDRDDLGWAIDNYPSAQGVINRHVVGDGRSGVNVSDVGRGLGDSAGQEVTWTQYVNRSTNWDGRTPGMSYQWECMDAWTATAIALYHAGYADVFEWGNSALRRNMQWIRDNNGFTNTWSDVRHTPHLVNHVYGTSFPEEPTSNPGRVWAVGEWLTASGSTWLK